MPFCMTQDRISHKWSMAYVGKCVGLTKSTVNDIEKGRCKPSYEVLVKLENLYGRSHRELFSQVDVHK